MKVDIQLLVDVLITERLKFSKHSKACVVDDDINTTKVVDGLLECFLHIRTLDHIKFDDEQLFIISQGLEGGQGVDVACSGDKTIAMLEHSFSEGTTKARRTASDWGW